MSVTIMPEGNIEFCQIHGLTTTVWQTCYCVHIGESNPDCFECNGTGRVGFEERPFELNMANGNFGRLWSDLALDPGEDYFGRIDPRYLATHLGTPELSVRDQKIEETDTGGLLISGGVTLEQAVRYHTRLRDICHEAEKREVMVVWG